MRKIVIVDDSEDLLEVLRFFLEEKGFTIETATNYAQLVSLVKSFSPDLVMLDIFLQHDDGREICKKLREHDSTKYVCILLFSAYTKVLAGFQEYGADGFIEKPFGLKALIDKIESTLESCKDYHPQRMEK